jgi:hypothetical protein
VVHTVVVPHTEAGVEVVKVLNPDATEDGIEYDDAVADEPAAANALKARLPNTDRPTMIGLSLELNSNTRKIDANEIQNERLERFRALERVNSRENRSINEGLCCKAREHKEGERI